MRQEIESVKSDCKKLFAEIDAKPLDIEKAIQLKHEKIVFLEGMYMTGKSKFSFSEEFKSAAVKERDRECIITSALHDILRELKENKQSTREVV